MKNVRFIVSSWFCVVSRLDSSGSKKFPDFFRYLGIALRALRACCRSPAD
jgi:hypothetical protein